MNAAWTKEITRGIAIAKKVVAADYGLTVAQLEGPGRPEPLATARHVAIVIARHLTDASFPILAAAFNKKHHDSAMHACKSIGDRSSVDDALCKRVARLMDKAHHLFNPEFP